LLCAFVLLWIVVWLFVGQNLNEKLLPPFHWAAGRYLWPFLSSSFSRYETPETGKAVGRFLAAQNGALLRSRLWAPSCTGQWVGPGPGWEISIVVPEAADLSLWRAQAGPAGQSKGASQRQRKGAKGWTDTQIVGLGRPRRIGEKSPPDPRQLLAHGGNRGNLKWRSRGATTAIA